MHMLLKQKSPSLPTNLVLVTFGKLLIVLLTKVNLLYLLYSMVQRCCLLDLIKQNSLLKTTLRTLIFMTQVSLYLFSLLKLIWNCIIFLTSKMVKKVITNLDSSKASGADCIPVVVLQNCELWAWTFIHTSWILKHVSERVLFSRLLEGLIGGPCI